MKVWWEIIICVGLSNNKAMRVRRVYLTLEMCRLHKNMHSLQHWDCLLNSPLLLPTGS